MDKRFPGLIIAVSLICLGASNYSPPRQVRGQNQPGHFFEGKVPQGETITADSTHDFDALKYFLELDPYINSNALMGTVGLTFRPMVANFDTLILDAQNLSISGVSDSFGALNFQYLGNQLKIFLRQAYQPQDTTAVNIQYSAPRITSNYQYGFHRNTNNYAYTFGEPYGARTWFPCYDLPFDKAQAELQIQVPANYIAAANGELTDTVNTSTGVLYIWQEEDPIATYLISIACGPYIELTAMTSDSIPLYYYVFPEDTAQAEYDFENTPDMVEFFSSIFGAYPFQMYGMAEAQIFNGWGAMEHQSVTTYGSNLIRGDRYYERVVSHELSHMWWGDALTPLTFADIWLNEGFATYCECLYIEARYDTMSEYLEIIGDEYFYEYQAGHNYALYDPPPDYLFGTTIYCKGGWVQHMLRMVIGDDAFFQGLQNYFQDYLYGNVITSEYQAEMETAAGEDLDWFFQEWVYQPGFPQYSCDWQVEPAGVNFSVNLNIQQIQTSAPIFTMPVEIFFSSQISDTTLTVWNNQQQQEFAFTLNFQPETMILDPENKILNWETQTGVGYSNTPLPYRFGLREAYPNPFNSSIIIPFTLDRALPAKLAVYNQLGQEVWDLGFRNWDLGENQVVWAAEGFSSGMYYIALSDGQRREIKPVILLK